MQPLVEKYKPSTLAGFAGLDRARAVLGHFAAAPYSSAWLLVGPSGLGKTTMALAIAEQIGGQLHHIPSQKCDKETVDSVCQKCFYRPWTGNWNIVLADEADQMSRAAQLAFLSKLDTTAAPPDTIFIFTANDTTLLADRFLSRCRVIKFEPPAAEPIAELLQRVWQAETDAPAPDFEVIITESKFNIRECLMRLEIELIAGPDTSRPRSGVESRVQQRSVRLPVAIDDPTRHSAPEPGETLDAYAVAKHLGINVATLYNRIKMGRVPEPDRSGRKMLWSRGQIEAAA
jgi:putative ATPase